MSDKKNKANVKNIVTVGSAFLLLLVLWGSYATVRAMNEDEVTYDDAWDEPIIVANVVSKTDTPEEVEEKPAPLTSTAQATVSVMGDIMGHKAMLTAAYNPTEKTYNFDNIFPYIQKYVSASDYAVANLETTLRGTENGGKYQGYPTFNTPDTIADAVKKAGFDMLLTANNHSNDTGLTGMNRTLEVLNSKGLDHIGTMLEAGEKKYIVKDVNGIKIGMMCYTYETNGANSKTKYLNGTAMKSDAAELINSFNYERLDDFYTELTANITAMKGEGAEEIMLFIHWGTEYKTAPNKYQQQIAQKVCDLGVDVIVGGHPHVIQPIDLLTSSSDSSHKTLCIYSTGNAVSNQRRSASTLQTGHTEDGCLFSVTFTKYSDGRVVISDTNLLPTWVNVFVDVNTQRNVYRIVPLDKSDKMWGITFDMKEGAVKNAEESYDRTMAIAGEGLEKAQQYYRAAAAAILSDSDLSR